MDDYKDFSEDERIFYLREAGYLIPEKKSYSDCVFTKKKHLQKLQKSWATAQEP